MRWSLLCGLMWSLNRSWAAGKAQRLVQRYMYFASEHLSAYTCRVEIPLRTVSGTPEMQKAS